MLVFALRGILDTAVPPPSFDAYARELSRYSETDIQSMLGASVAVRCEFEAPSDGISVRGTVLLRIAEHGLSEATHRTLNDTIVLAVKGAFNKTQALMAANVRLSDLQAVQTGGGPPFRHGTRARSPARERRGIGLVVALLLGMLVSDAHWLIARDARHEPGTTLSATNASAATAASGSPGFEQLQAIYLRSIEQAAVRKPGMRVPLAPIVSDPVQMVTFSNRPPVDSQNKLAKPTWVSHPSELVSLCRRSADSLLAVQQALGLPPYRSANEMQNTRAYVLEIRKADLFRPCVSSTDTATSACEMSPSAAKPRLQADIDDSQYVIEKLWTAHSTGFSEIGYPFTGMGWTYNWNPLSRDHIGVSEYVGRKDASVNIKAVLTADEFCSGTY
ncbi:MULTISPECIES: hypothetical protein [unclassified Caballeronia]|uniref:hypothetical protein n=1 Tax=unclassified Caballeronia TaxID=2646786 RepID=UPI001F223D0E|nr:MULTISPECIES: hypothetical protein [unclassified Caballeronia]MCE4547604.1 hypothetical protein [Caballeronia sp. PC1]MCE4575062.1 hypothetical protein [Caballeronia sp. CLC5]